MAPLAERLAGARAAAGDPAIRVTDIEHGSAPATPSIPWPALRRRYPRARFVWLMGADILPQMPRWKRWQRIFRTVPIAVFARPTIL